MYDIIPLILILVGLAVSLSVVLKKFSILANLDVSNIKSEKEAKFKERIISERLKRSLLKMNFHLAKVYKPVKEKTGDVFSLLHDKLLDLKVKHSNAPVIEQKEIPQSIDQMFASVEEANRDEDFSKSERLLIKIISLDPKNIKAFRQLARVYYLQKNYLDARQTFEHVLKLAEDSLGEHNVLLENFDGMHDAENETMQAETYYYLGLINRDMSNLDDAVRNFNNALSIEPNNPRYLDTGLEISIMIKDKAWANKLIESLKKSNPENNKISDFEERISIL